MFRGLLLGLATGGESRIQQLKLTQSSYFPGSLGGDGPYGRILKQLFLAACLLYDSSRG